MKHLSILVCALFLAVLSAWADGTISGTMHFKADGFEYAEGKSAPGRPAVLNGSYFKYDNVNECGYGFECLLYDKFLKIKSTTDYNTFNYFGAFTTFEGIYIKVEE